MDKAIHYAHHRDSQLLIIFLKKVKIMSNYLALVWRSGEIASTKTQIEIWQLSQVKAAPYHPRTCMYQFLQPVVSRSPHWKQGCFQQQVSEAVKGPEDETWTISNKLLILCIGRRLPSKGSYKLYRHPKQYSVSELIILAFSIKVTRKRNIT